MRTLKYTPNALSAYRHDGQMGIEDEEWSTDHFVTRYGLGARGVDMIERTSSTGTVTAFPLYDGHGNDVASLTRDGSGGYSLADRRSYDAWGVVRSQQSGGDPKLRYCANLGHKADDETGLVYMRARYYEPGSGRFVSEDSEGDGRNWFSYTKNDSINQADRTGKFTILDIFTGQIDEFNEKFQEICQAANVKDFVGRKVLQIMLDWAEQYSLVGEELGLDASNDIALVGKGNFRIMLHFTEEAATGEGPHLQLWMDGAGENVEKEFLRNL